MAVETSHLSQTLLLAADLLPFGIILLGPKSRVIFANHTAESLVNLRTGSLAGTLLSEVLPPEWAKDFSPLIPRTLECQIAGKSILVSFWPLKRTGVSPNKTLVQEVSGVVVLEDITKVTNLEKENLALRESVRDLHAIFESSYDEIYVTDGEGKTLRVNSACERFYGIPAEELIGKNVSDLEREGVFSPSITPLVLKLREPVTLVQTTKNGRRIVATANPIFDTDGRIVRIVTNSRDVTEFHNLKTRLAETEDLVNLYLDEIRALRQEHLKMDDIVVKSEAMRRVVETVKRVASFDSTVLLQGESGTGKDTVAKMIHRLSPRASGPFIKVNCGAIPEALMESEFFGYVPGAFTGAHRTGKAGVIELANKGTLFLNEIDALPLQLQVKMLHVIQERQFMKVGGTKVISVDTRIIAASNRDLRQLVNQSRFREDLFYRLNVIPITIPPLRNRQEDIAPLAAHFLRRFCAQYGVAKNLTPSSVELLSTYSWPGNVRELENAIERAVVISAGKTIQPDDFPEHIRAASRNGRTTNDPEADAFSTSTIDYEGAIAALEKQLLIEALKTHRTTRRAAKSLGISQSTVVRKMKRYGINATSQ